ncbi:MAG TPA: hypothetical protein DCQ28_06375 [Bacteroidetes bacterium]|nr:hypothetical protein [Bacteroidota bacterium]
MVSDVTIKKNNVRIKFTHAEGGLVTSNKEKLIGFAIAGSDKKFIAADAVIKGNEIIVSHPMVKNPASVRYAWADNPNCNLYNKSGLPASPFRTDDWKEVTFGKQ